MTTTPPVGDRTEGDEVTMPSEVSPGVGFFDRFASAVATFAARASFFAACLLLVLVWVPTIVWLKVDTWQLIINTVTTIITFLLVALLQNTQTRSDAAVQHKLNAIADALSDLMDHLAQNDPQLLNDRRELRAAVGLEERESA